MAKKKIKSRPGLFGMVYHYDENGKCIGKSRPGLFGDSTIHYDDKGEHIATSRPGFISEEVHYGKKNKRYISSYPGLIGSFHRSNGRTIGTTRPGFFDRSYTTLESDEDEYIEDYEGEEYFEDDENFHDSEDIDYNAEDTSIEFEEDATQESHCSNQSKENSAPTSGIKRIAKLVVGLFGVLGIIVCTLIAIEDILSGNNIFLTIIALVICFLLFRKLALWGLLPAKGQ